MKNELTTIENKFSPIVAKAQELAIADEKSMGAAAQYLSELNLFLDKIVAYKETKTKPLNSALKIIRAETKPFETQLDEMIALIRRKMSAYQTEKKRLADEQEARIAARVGEGKGHLKVETAARQMEEVERPVGAVTAESGMVKFKTVKCFEVMDLSIVPLEYHLADEVKIRKEMNLDKEIPGVRYWTEQRPDNYR